MGHVIKQRKEKKQTKRGKSIQPLSLASVHTDPAVKGKKNKK